MIDLKQKYERDDFIAFLENSFLKDFKRDTRPIGVSSLNTISKAESLGRSESLDLQVFEIEYTGSSKKRISLTKEAFQILKNHATYRALAVFHARDSDDWRISFMTANPERTEKGKVTVAYSNPRRYSFFLGPNAKVNTPTKFLISKGLVADFEDLKSRFSLEIVNKEFYKEIALCFTKLVGGTRADGKKQQDYNAQLKLPSIPVHSQINDEFAVRLIGRIIFCWFLREKVSPAGLSLMPKKLLSLDAIADSSDYYHSILEPIFFELLNKPMKSRRDGYVNKEFSSITYLNGGLFSPQEDDFYSYNEGKQAVNHNTVIVPDGWLAELFEVLEQYNFTIDENTTFDEELSIDPEMLGRIFENLLAEINPETGESARKSTGSYYTPRVIVDYMIDESLLLYLQSKTKIDERKLRSVISYDLLDDETNPLKNEENSAITGALEKIKILDPACGSGAFPIGALQKIVFILQQVDPDGQLWFKKQIESTSPEIRRVMEREFEHKNFDYIRKLGIIRENIYGVDIQPIASEISRLRCFLTLIVDQNIQDADENRGIEPLPNLDFKFVTANSLIGLPNIDGSGQEELFDDREKIDDLRLIRDQYFTASGIEREQLKTEFVMAQKKLVDQLIKEHGFMGVAKAELTQKLTDWEPLSHKSSSWFDSEWMFGIKDGFDIVIANPPYIQIKQIPWADRKLYKRLFKSAVGRFNIFYFFLEKSNEFTKSEGISSFIVPDRLLLNTQCYELRQWLLNYQQIIEIDSFDQEVFDSAIVDSILIFFRNIKNVYNSIQVRDKVILENISSTGTKTVPIEYFKGSSNIQFDLSYDEKKSITIDKIRQASIELGKISEIKDGIIQGKVADVLFLKQPQDSDSKKLLFGEDTNRYVIHFNNNWVNYKQQEMLQLEIKRRGPGIRYGLWMRTPEIFERKKILTRQTADEIIASYDEDNFYYSNTLHGTTIIDPQYDPLYVLALLNSKLMSWYYRKTTAEEGKVFAQVKIELLRLLPIYKTLQTEQKIFVEIVSKIMAITKTDDYLENPTKKEEVEEYEKQIDQLVYKLYGLTPEEIAIIEEKES